MPGASRGANDRQIANDSHKLFSSALRKCFERSAAPAYRNTFATFDRPAELFRFASVIVTSTAELQMTTMTTIYQSLLITLMLAAALPVCAQNAEPRRYEPNFFQSYAPVTAWDMVQRVPNFVLNDVGNARGFGVNAGNVLINGERPSSKSDSLSILLARIPAGQVAYLELSNQAGNAADASGKAQVLNVILLQQEQLQGTVDALLDWMPNGNPRPSGSVAINRVSGANRYDLGLSLNDQRFAQEGLERESGNSSLRLFETDLRNRLAKLSLGVHHTGEHLKANGNFNLQWNDYGTTRSSEILRGNDRALLGREQVRSQFPAERVGLEIGGDVEFPLSAQLQSKWIALYSRFSSDGRAQLQQEGPVLPALSRQTQNQDDSSEAILRLQNTSTWFNQHQLQFGVEATRNLLDTQFLSSTGGAAVSTRAISVSETRIEPFIADVWKLTNTWNLESALVIERSTLDVTGDSRGQRDFWFVKPRLVASFAPSPKHSIELRLERQVSQLDFNEFATSVDLTSNGQVDAGNAELRPFRANRLSAKWRYGVGERGSVQLLAAYAKQKDTQDFIPINLIGGEGQNLGRVDAWGNIGDGKLWDVELDVTMPAIGGELKYTGHYHGSEVTDPSTQTKRSLSRRPKHHHYLQWRADFPQAGWAIGSSAFWAADGTGYFFNQTDRFSNPLEASAFVEYTGLKLGKLALTLSNINDAKRERERLFFAPDRSTGTLRNRIERESEQNLGVQIAWSTAF
jgi:hypothetical protein